MRRRAQPWPAARLEQQAGLAQDRFGLGIALGGVRAAEHAQRESQTQAIAELAVARDRRARMLDRRLLVALAQCERGRKREIGLQRGRAARPDRLGRLLQQRVDLAVQRQAQPERHQ